MTRLILRIAIEPEGRLGPGKIELLERIAEHGSIAAAGRSMAMSYRRAWQLIDETQRLCGRPVVLAQIGGARGGGATLTPFGAALVARFRAIEKRAAEAVADDLDALLAEP
jgi:molybdate transport system regulatory protein